MIQLDQLPQLPHLSYPSVSDDDDLVALSWGPRYEEVRVYGDLLWSPFWTTATTTSFGSGEIFRFATTTVFAVRPSYLALGDDAGTPRM
jgi:hypothetical protein